MHLYVWYNINKAVVLTYFPSFFLLAASLYFELAFSKFFVYLKRSLIFSATFHQS